MPGIFDAIWAVFGFGKSTVDLARENKQRANEPVQLAESQQEKVDEKKQEISEALEPGKGVEEIRNRTRYPGPQ